MDIETSEQLAFIPEQVESILMTVVDGILRTEVYLEEKVISIFVHRAGEQKQAGTTRSHANVASTEESSVEVKKCVLRHFVNVVYFGEGLTSAACRASESTPLLQWVGLERNMYWDCRRVLFTRKKLPTLNQRVYHDRYEEEKKHAHTTSCCSNLNVWFRWKRSIVDTLTRTLHQASQWVALSVP